MIVFAIKYKTFHREHGYKVALDLQKNHEFTEDTICRFAMKCFDQLIVYFPCEISLKTFAMKARSVMSHCANHQTKQPTPVRIVHHHEALGWIQRNRGTPSGLWLLIPSSQMCVGLLLFYAVDAASLTSET